MGAPVRGLEYTHSADSGSATVISVGCETLVRYDKTGGLRPALAASFSAPNPDDVRLPAASRRQVLGRPHDDGRRRPVLAAAGREQDRRLADRRLLLERRLDEGDRAAPITIKLKSPDPYFRYSPAVTYILEKAFWQKNGKKVGAPGTLTMCTGPYRFTRFVRTTGSRRPASTATGAHVPL